MNRCIEYLEFNPCVHMYTNTIVICSTVYDPFSFEKDIRFYVRGVDGQSHRFFTSTQQSVEWYNLMKYPV